MATVTAQHSVKITGTIVKNLWQVSRTGKACDNVNENLDLQYGSLAQEMRQMGFSSDEAKRIMFEHLGMALSLIETLAEAQA